MKAHFLNNDNFKPLSLSIEITSQQELDILRTLFGRFTAYEIIQKNNKLINCSDSVMHVCSVVYETLASKK